MLAINNGALVNFFNSSSGLGGLLTDAREFLAVVRLARPDALWLLLLLPLLGLLNRWASRRRKHAVATIGRPAAVAGQLTHPRPPRRWLGFTYPLAWALLILGVAGPRWGKSDEPGVAVGRDVVIVIDLSRSMLAEDMSDPKAKTRWEGARAGALDLLNTMVRRGGHRVGVIVFASKPKVLCPVTTDYKHVKDVLEDINGKFPPPECKAGADPNITSGTRFGSALIAAVEMHDSQFKGSQDVFFISDGDDPDESDREWVRGANAARAANVPVYTVGVGHPTKVAVPEIESVADPFGTKLQEELLEQIARETSGEYIAARTSNPQLGEFFHNRIDVQKVRTIVGEDQVPQPKERYPWVLAPALLLFLGGWLRGR
ncbi:von Willebrand factor type A domain protein [Gemmata sp. SH-PL17]|uniref:vWA domain-containing protein n=1 Tax=Gemmata sp. SH-PL17 TaxID=1630693 RepID=UPI00078D5002|nr:VWA domain-containing protein [Gemmata sp. SH-PL17]AMV29811.1 von Willebrand factor type A domain protein [Gemmata sp. SH-PL17]